VFCLRDGKLAARARFGAVEAPLGLPHGFDARLGADLEAPAPEATVVTATFERVVDRLELRVDRLATIGLGAIRESFPPWAFPRDPSGPQFEPQMRDSLRSEVASLRVGRLPAMLPAADAFLLEIAGEAGDLDALAAGYRFAQGALWSAWFDLTAAVTASAAARQALHARGSRFLMRYADLVGRFLVEEYGRRSGRGAGDPAPFGPCCDGSRTPFADDAPGFELGRYHLGLIAWGGSVEATVRELAVRLNRVSRICGRGSLRWVCFSGQEKLCERDLADLRPAPGVRLAIGLDGFGREGLSATFRQARRAHALAAEGAAVTRYADIAIESLALQGEGEVRAFVSHELSGIDDGSASSARLRETLATYFETDQNAASTAARLGVHHQTVANRLRTIEDRIGRPLMARTPELALALRLHKRLSS
jgi:hypothetical protein